MIRKYLSIFTLVILAVGFVGCQDELIYPDDYIGEGEAAIEATLSFEPLVQTPTGGSRGSAGNIIKSINNITINDKEGKDIAVFVYDSQNKLVRIYDHTDWIGGSYSETGNTDHPAYIPTDSVAEKNTPQATFKLSGLRFGRYHIYAVANMGLTNTEKNVETYASPDALKSKVLTWNKDNIAANNQMFGFFGIDGSDDKDYYRGYEAPLLTVSQKATTLHGWLKRAASKVTIVYDGSGLLDGINIYIKSVTIRDIPKKCFLGRSNDNIKDTTDLISVGQSIYYDSKGEVDNNPNITDWNQWLHIQKITPLVGSVVTEKQTDGTVKIVETHAETAQAMFFYENMQGNYQGQKKYDKRQDPAQLGYIPQGGKKDGVDNEYKDNVICGTYIEVEGYYVSNNPQQISSGYIKYRYMLGLDDTYNYNAERNHHYKIKLGFNGFANQPDWHVVYKEEPNEVQLEKKYFISYGYNHTGIFPVRLVPGANFELQKMEVEIVENNWAPYDSLQKDNIPPASISGGTAYSQQFNWNRKVYENNGGTGSYYYGLQNPFPRNGSGDKGVDYTTLEAYNQPNAPTSIRKVTPIWAGFLAVNKPDNDAIIYGGSTYWYGPNSWGKPNVEVLKKHFYENSQNYREFDFTTGDLKTNVIDKWNAANADAIAGKPNAAYKAVSTKYGSGKLETVIVKAADGSITVDLPMFTRPKSMLSISGFTGNNPYDTYQRKATVLLTATFKGKNDKNEFVERKVYKYMPVYQCRRIVNPKAVWRRYDNDDPFHVTLMRRHSPGDGTSQAFNSDGEWKAYISAGNESKTINLTAGTKSTTKNDTVFGDSGTPIDFWINFKALSNYGDCECAIVTIEYNGRTSYHNIFVRQGYDKPLDITGKGKAEWSSYNIFSFAKDTPFGTTWDNATKNYIKATLTTSPLALGSLFKRGNYNGILVKNNATSGLGRNEAPGNKPFEMTWGNSLSWKNIQGKGVMNGNNTKVEDISFNQDYSWGRFEIEKKNGTVYYYAVPTYEQFNDLTTHSDFGIGVMYADGASKTASDINNAFGFEDPANKPNIRKEQGVRGIIVYNPKNGNQLFFPIGARGIGRRTNQNASGNNSGVLRYGAVDYLLESDANAYRPIPFNIQFNPGAIYWINKLYSSNNYTGWDMNYFDMNINAYDYAALFGYGSNGENYGGDALPIKPVIAK